MNSDDPSVLGAAASAQGEFFAFRPGPDMSGPFCCDAPP